MNLNIASRSGMCSTLILSDLWGIDELWEVVTKLRSAIEWAENKENFDTLYSPWHEGNKQKMQVLDGNDVSDHAFVIGTLEDDSYAIQPMKEFGFEFSERVRNSKSDTYVLHFIMPVKRMLKRLKDFDKNGNLIKKEAA